MLKPSQRVSDMERETLDPMTPQKVTNRTRSRFTVESGVISVVPLVYSVVEASPFWQRYPGRTAHRVLGGSRSALLGHWPAPGWSIKPVINPSLPGRRGRPGSRLGP